MACTLQFQPALTRPDLLSPTLFSLLKNWQGSVPASEISVAEIDPDFAGGKELCEHYKIPEREGAICVVVEAVRGNNRRLAACVALVNQRIDFNGIVRKTLNARRVSLAPIDEVLQETQMEYGSITPMGLPKDWPILIDEKIANLPRVIIGAGLIQSKLALPGQALIELAGAQVLVGLGRIV